MCAPHTLDVSTGAAAAGGSVRVCGNMTYSSVVVLVGSTSPLPSTAFTLLPLSVGTACSWRGSGKCGQGEQLGTLGTSEKGRKSVFSPEEASVC